MSNWLDCSAALAARTRCSCTAHGRSSTTPAGRLVLIGQATPRQAAHFRSRQQIELPVLADERRASYAAAGAKIATFGELLGPKVVAKGAATTAKYGVVQGRTAAVALPYAWAADR